MLVKSDKGKLSRLVPRPGSVKRDPDLENAVALVIGQVLDTPDDLMLAPDAPPQRYTGGAGASHQQDGHGCAERRRPVAGHHQDHAMHH